MSFVKSFYGNIPGGDITQSPTHHEKVFHGNTEQRYAVKTNEVDKA